MNTFLIIVSVCIVVAVFAINSARMIKLEDEMHEMQSNMQTINKIAGEAIESFGKFVEELQKGINTAKKENEDKNA